MTIKRTVWVIMDKKRKVIACGVPRNRSLVMVENIHDRILTYESAAKARAAFHVSWFYEKTDVDDYLFKTYDFGHRYNAETREYTYGKGTKDDAMEVVEAEMTFELKD